MSTYVYDSPVVVKFQGGRWDGLEVLLCSAPEEVGIVAFCGHEDTPAFTGFIGQPGEVRYVREAICIPPLNYFAQ